MPLKRKVSGFIPYKIESNEVLVYLQKRTKDAERLPDYFGFFGGGAENNETPKEALLREIKEEMNFTPEGYKIFGGYEFEDKIETLFILEVNDNFESKIEILEGEYGKWFGEKDILQEPKLIEEDKIVLKDFYLFFKNKIKE